MPTYAFDIDGHTVEVQEPNDQSLKDYRFPKTYDKLWRENSERLAKKVMITTYEVVEVKRG